MSNEHRVREFWRRVWSEGDVAYAHEFFAQQYLENDRTRTPEAHGKAALGLREMFPDLSAEVVRVLVKDDVVVTRVRYRGTYSGGFPGVSAPGSVIDIGGLDVFRFDGGVVVEHLHEADHESLWEQLGVALPPG